MGLFGLFGKKVMLQCTCGCGCRDEYKKYSSRAMSYYAYESGRYEKPWRNDHTICIDCNLDQHTNTTDISVHTQNRQDFSSEVKRRTFKNQGKRCNDCKRRIGEVDGKLVFFDYDHIDGDRTNNDPSNCQVLCKNCHQHKTERERNSKR